MIVFFDTLYAPLATTGNCSAIADQPTLLFTVTHTLVFSVPTSRDFNIVVIPVSLSLQHTQPASSFAMSYQSFYCHPHRLSQISAATAISSQLSSQS
jgi:hypothetical protein